MNDAEKTITAMRQLGGGFVRQLADLWCVADAANRRRLESAFAPEFFRYAELAKQTVELT